MTIDYDSLEDQTVTVRDRNSMEQVRVKDSDLVSVLQQLVKGEQEFSSLK
ncbi:MAG: His/Gly/Thr/Pro-type tRNA ligase C-terminal domain-containing protein [Candidatus Thorarchaeota archaeon]